MNGDRKSDIVVGDSYTKTGIASGSGNDNVRGLWDDDFLYGDNYAATQKGEVLGGGGRDTLNGAGGNDRLIGGPREDICAGGSGHDRVGHCEHALQIP